MKSMLALSIFLMSILHADWKRIIGSSDIPVPPDKKVMKSDTLGVYIRTTIFGFNEEDTTIDSKDFRRVAIPDEDVDWDTLNIGKPQIPFIRMLIAVPDSAVFDLKIHSGDYTVFEDHLIYPVPRIVYKDTSGCACSEEIYTYDTNFYEKDTIYPGKFYELMNNGYWRDQRVLEVILYPVQFNPKQKLMYFYDFLDLRIDYSGTVVENENGLGPFEAIGREVLLNYPGIDKEPESQVPPSVHFYTNLDTSNVADYIIVTHEDFSTNDSTLELIEQLAQWRVDHNQFEVGIVEIQDVYDQFDSLAPDSAAQLRDFLIYAYDNWTAPAMPDGHFGYCLLIGDWDYVPTQLYEYTQGDIGMLGAKEGYFRNFGGIGDEIMLGRFPVKETYAADLVTIVKKTINYEKYPDTTDHWRRRGLLIAGGGDGAQNFDRSVTSSTPYFADISYDTLTVRWLYLDSNSGAFCDSIQTHLNNGILLTAYYDHGAPGGWWGGYDTAWVKHLTNGDTLVDSLTVVLSDACLTAMFQWDHPFYSEDSTHLWYNPAGVSFGEHFLFNPDGGAVIFVGSTIYTTLGAVPARAMIHRMFRDQVWITGKSFATSRGTIAATSCLLGDPALDLGDYTAYPHLPDLVVKPKGVDIRLPHPAPYYNSGDTIPIRAKILNIGGTKASDIDVRFEIYCNEVRIYDDTVNISKIQPRDSAIATSYWRTGATHPNYCGEIGDCQFRVTVDPFSEIDESWEANNQSEAVYKIALYPYKPGWPKAVVGFSQPAIANLNNADSVEIVYASSDSIYVYKPDGSVCTGWPQDFNRVYAVTLADLDCAGNMEIIAVSPESVTVYDYQGNTVSGWPQCIPDTSKQFHGFPAVGYIAGTSERQVILYIGGKEQDELPGLAPVQSAIMVYDHDGDSLYHLTHDHMDAFNSYRSSGAAISEVNNDGKDEIIVSYEYHHGTDDSSFTEIFNRNGHVRTLKWGSCWSTSALADLSGDDVEDMVITSAIDDTVRAYDAVNDKVLWKKATIRPVNSSPAVGDIHPLVDGNEVTFGNDTSQVYLLGGMDGVPVFPWPYIIGETANVRVSPAIANINGDANLDIIIGDNNSYVYAFKHTKDIIPPFPLPLFGNISSPIIGDIDGDGISEIIVSSSDGYLHIWENRDSSVRSYSLEWPQFHHDHQRTGLYGW